MLLKVRALQAERYPRRQIDTQRYATGNIKTPHSRFSMTRCCSLQIFVWHACRVNGLMSERHAILSIRWRRCRLLLEGHSDTCRSTVDLHYIATFISLTQNSGSQLTISINLSSDRQIATANWVVDTSTKSQL